MDMYRILESFDAVNSRATVSEGEVKRAMHADADKMSRAEFVDKYGAENGEFWDIVRGDDDEELDEERRSEEEFDADALAKQKARLAREKQKIMMQRKISGQDSGKPPAVQDMSEAEDEDGTDPTKTKHEGDQGYSDASRGINKNPYGANTPAGRAYQAGQAAYKQHFGESQELNLILSRAGLVETAPYQPETDADHNDPLAAKAADDAAVGPLEEDGVDPVNAQGQDAEDLHGQATSSVAGAVDEAEYQGRKVQLGKKMAGDVKKSKVYVRGPKGNVVKVNFGDPNMRIKKSNPARRKSFRARHNCDNPGPRWKARYWSCRSW